MLHRRQNNSVVEAFKIIMLINNYLLYLAREVLNGTGMPNIGQNKLCSLWHVHILLA